MLGPLKHGSSGHPPGLVGAYPSHSAVLERSFPELFHAAGTLASFPGPHEEKRAWYPLRAHAQFHQVFLALCNPLRIILWYTSGYFACYAIPRHFAVLLTSEAHKRSEQTRSSSHLHANSPDTCTVKNACGFTACYPENLLSYLAHAHAVDTRPSFLREDLWTRLLLLYYY